MRAAAALLILLAGCGSGGGAGSPLLVEVSGEAIRQADLDLEAKFSPRQDKAALLEELVDQALILQEAARRGIGLSADELEDQLRLARAGMDPATFEEELKARGLSLAQWKERVRRTALCAEAVRRIVRTRIALTRQDLKDYYWEHVTRFRRPAQVRLRQVFTRSRSQAEKALEELRLGEDFGEVAARYSKGPEASAGGDLGWVSREGLPEKLGEAAFQLKDGKAGPILATRWGYHILKSEGRRPARNLSLEEAAPQLHEALLREREQPLYRDWLFELRGRAEIRRYRASPEKGTP